MTPSLPFDIPAGTTCFEVVDPLECEALRLGQPCGNDAIYVLSCPVRFGAVRLLPVCQVCITDASEPIFDATGKTWIEHLEELQGA